MATGQLDLNSLAESIALLIEQKRPEDLRVLIAPFRPEDVAEVLLNLEEEDIRQVLRWVDPETASELIENINDEYWYDILSPMAPQRLFQIIREMPSDEAADVLEELDDDLREQILNHQEAPEALGNVTALLSYPEETAGSLMNPDIVLVPEHLSVGQALNLIRKNIDEFKDINYIYITDQDSRLVGVLPLPLLISTKDQTLLEEVMLKDFIAVDVLMPAEDVVEIVRKYELTTVPVVDTLQQLKGIITIDDVIDVMEELADEEMYKMAALGDVEEQDTVLKAATARIPWLVVCLGGSLVAGSIIHLFNHTLERLIILAAFMPAIMAMAGNSGIQTSTLIIRNLGTGPSLRNHLFKLVRKEIQIATLIGLICGLIATVVAFGLFRTNPLIGGVVGISLWLSIIFSSCMGILFPFLLEKANVDPAVASGPIITTLNDSIALSIYLGLGTAIMPFI